jgi:hypothetical protein
MATLFKSRERLDDRGVLGRPPLSSIYFVFTSAMGLGCVAMAGYILHRHWLYLSRFWVVLLIGLVAAQVLYQMVEAIRLIPLVKEFYSIASAKELAPDSPLGHAIHGAVAGVADRLFFSYGITLGLLGVVAKVLSLLHPA